MDGSIFIGGVVDVVVFVGRQFLKVWPYLLLTIPLATAVRVSGASARLREAMSRRPAVSILLAVLIGAVSPLCSCTVIPVIFSLLTAGVPLAPVMAFWVASPSMDPEIFLLSATTLGWPLAIWRLASTTVLSLAAGFITAALVKRGVFRAGVLKADPDTRMATIGGALRGLWRRVVRPVKREASAAPGCDCATSEETPAAAAVSCCSPENGGATPVVIGDIRREAGGTATAPSGAAQVRSARALRRRRMRFLQKVAQEALKSLLFVVQFMILAYVLEAIIVLYVPERWILAALGRGGFASVGLAALLGIPVYTTNIAALGILGGLLSKGMLPGAALAFLISGPTTTLPAMSAVYGIAKGRVFALYLGFAFLGALFFGLLMAIFT
jgi:uncharacterized membrane protein YraQ (UPF0718 family)